MNVWDNFYRLDYLDLAFVNNTSAQRATIYGNSQNRIAISIKVKIVDKNNNSLVIPADELLRSAHLVQFRNCKRLNWEGSGPDSKPWVYTRSSNDYTEVPAFDAVLTDSYVEQLTGAQEVIFYLYATDASSGIDIAAGFNVPGVGDFNTSENGTQNRNGPKGESGSMFKNPKSKHIIAVEKINYSDKTNIEMDKSVLEHTNNFSWVSRFWNSGPFAEHGNGRAMAGYVTFKPKNASVKNFKQWSIVYETVKNADVNRYTVHWPVNVLEEGFFALPGDVYPGAVIYSSSRGSSSDDGHVNFWHSGEGKFIISGHFFLRDSNYTYRCAPYASGQHVKPINPTIYIYKMIIPTVSSAGQLGWEDCIRKPAVKVVDVYGNSGEFRLNFDDKDNFDSPGII